ncbi:hypothetical protein BDR26DRAFT_858080 [Obelidium mucronatum]|nr:hypothetical protein BDR26DRAFT_858080 [Obelidium mucronatum]
MNSNTDNSETLPLLATSHRSHRITINHIFALTFTAFTVTLVFALATDPRPSSEEIARIEMLGAQMVRYAFHGAAPSFGSEDSRDIYGIKDAETNDLTVFCVKSAEQRSVAEIIASCSNPNTTKRVDWWIGQSTSIEKRAKLRQDLLQFGFVKQPSSGIDLWIHPQSARKAHFPVTAPPPTIEAWILREIVNYQDLKERWEFLGTVREKQLAFGPGENVRHFGDIKGRLVGVASISYYAGSVYINLVGAVDLHVQTTLVWLLLNLDQIRAADIKVIGIDTKELAIAELYETMGFARIPNLEGYVYTVQ